MKSMIPSLFRFRQISILSGLIFIGWSGISQAAVLNLDFGGGNGSTQVDQYIGIAGQGWSTAWVSTDTGSITQTVGVSSSSPLQGSSGDYLQFQATSAASNKNSFINRGITNNATTGLDLTQNVTISFLFRLDSPLATNSTIRLFGNNSNTQTGTGSESWSISASSAGWNAGYTPGNVAGVITLEQGLTYAITLALNPSTDTFIFSIDNGTTSYTSGALNFRSTTGNTIGSYIYFGTQGLNSGLSNSFSIDSIAVVPEPTAGAMIFAGLLLLNTGRLIRIKQNNI